MNLKAIAAVSLGLSLLLPTSSTLAQFDQAPPASPTPDGTLAPEAPSEAAPPAETIEPESVPAPESSESELSEPDANIGGAEDGAKLYACGPNGAAVVSLSARTGCRLLGVNSPPGVK